MRSSRLVGLTYRRRCIETGIKAQRSNEGDLLVPTDCSQLDDAVCPIADERDLSIRKPSTYHLHELFGPVWNRFVSASQCFIHLFSSAQPAEERKCPRPIGP